jgi:hypothetical protein
MISRAGWICRLGQGQEGKGQKRKVEVAGSC